MRRCGAGKPSSPGSFEVSDPSPIRLLGRADDKDQKSSMAAEVVPASSFL
jgi:hypothetical protein